jgi:hypothetical protein
MHQKDLCTVLLIHSIEETDRTGEVIPLADRIAASREVVRESPKLSEGRDTETFLVRRAGRLLHGLRSRSPAVMHILSLAGGITWLGRFVLILALAVGVSMSALDGSRRINILAFPLIGLLAWNLLVYVLLVVSWIRSWGRVPESFWSARLYERWISGRIESLMRHSTRYNVPLSTGLRRFAAEWGALSQPIILLRAKLQLHLCAALVAVGLIAGLYLRGIVLRYDAGWESTFLGPNSAYVLVSALYGPASLLSGIPIGGTGDVAELSWTPTGGGGEAAGWIHLIAITTVLYIVIPRLIGVGAASVGLWRLSRKTPVPPSIFGYTRALLMGVGSGRATETASVIPYAYEPKPPSITGLESLLAATLGGNLKVDVLAPIRYGDESTVAARLAETSANWQVVLVTLASTPEVENHGALLTAWRDWLGKHAASTPLLILIDEGPYVARLRGEAVFDQRIQERRKLWREFVAGYGLRASFADLIQMKPGAASEINARDEARAALWTAGERA